VAREPEPRSVEVTMADGKVLHFLAGEGDKIVMNTVDTYIKDVPPRTVKYYTLMITPSESTKG
jgi:hypothetical protein